LLVRGQLASAPHQGVGHPIQATHFRSAQGHCSSWPFPHGKPCPSFHWARRGASCAASSRVFLHMPTRNQQSSRVNMKLRVTNLRMTFPRQKAERKLIVDNPTIRPALISGLPDKHRPLFISMSHLRRKHPLLTSRQASSLFCMQNQFVAKQISWRSQSS
jgi:hypothetical protein